MCKFALTCALNHAGHQFNARRTAKNTKETDHIAHKNCHPLQKNLSCSLHPPPPPCYLPQWGHPFYPCWVARPIQCTQNCTITKETDHIAHKKLPPLAKKLELLPSSFSSSMLPSSTWSSILSLLNCKNKAKASCASECTHGISGKSVFVCVPPWFSFATPLTFSFWCPCSLSNSAYLEWLGL